MNLPELIVLLDMLMTIDWPFNGKCVLVSFANREAKKRGYSDWIEAWHELGCVEVVGVKGLR